MALPQVCGSCGVILQPAAQRAWLSQSSSLTAAGLGWFWGLGWPAQLVPFQASFYSCAGMFQSSRKVELHLLCPPWGWEWSVGVWSSSILFSIPLLAQMLCPPFSKASSFCFLIAFSSLKSLPLAYQKLWLSKVLFLIWDQELILEAKKLNTDYFFLSVSQLFPFSFRFCGSCARKRRKALTVVFQDAFLPWHFK